MTTVNVMTSMSMTENDWKHRSMKKGQFMVTAHTTMHKQ